MNTIYIQQYEQTKGEVEIDFINNYELSISDWDVAAENLGDSLYKNNKIEQGYYDALLYDENHILIDHIILIA